MMAMRRLIYSTPQRLLSRNISVQQLVYDSFGDPAKVVRLESVSLPPRLNQNDVHVRWLGAPVNPADINQIQGVYPIKPPLPAVGGSEGYGRIEAVGVDVSSLVVGDHVIPSKSGLGTWRTNSILREDEVFKIDKTLPPDSSATLQVNPPTAYRMLADFVDLKPGDTVIQNGATSAVGRAVIQICRARGVKTVNIIRKRESTVEQKAVEDDLTALGADLVITEEQLVKDYRSSLGVIKLALNCVGGRSAMLLSMVLSDRGCMVTYGGMSRLPLTIPTGPLIFKDIRLVGFWMSRWYEQAANRPERERMYAELGSLIKSGALIPPRIQKRLLKEYATALELAQTSHSHKQIFIQRDD